MNKPARHRQADIARAVRVAKPVGARVILRPDGSIEIDTAPVPPAPGQGDISTGAPGPVAPKRDFVL